MDHEVIKGAENISLFCRLMTHERKQLPIRSSEMGLLILATKHTATLTPALAAQYFKVSKPMVAAMIRSLEQKGLLTKKPSTQDRRSFALQATEAGAMLVETTYAEYYKTMRLFEEKMGQSQFVQLVELLEAANKILLEEKNNG